MAKAKKSKVSWVAEKLETVKKKSPPKPKKPILESILESLDDDQVQVIYQAKYKVGDDLKAIRSEIEKIAQSRQSNFSAILSEIDKY